MNPFPVIPQEINIRVASFLSVQDIMKYQSSCKYLKNDINLNILHKELPNLSQSGSYDHGDEIIHWVTLTPFLFPNLIHTIHVTFDFRDQGWGNRKGVIYIMEEKYVGHGHNSGCIDKGTIIAMSPTAEHHETKCSLSFKPKKGFIYNLCYKVGGGGGHELHVRNMKVESFVHCAAVPLVNKLYPNLPDKFVLDMMKHSFDAIEETKGSGKCGGLISHFESVGLDLNNVQHIEHIKMMFRELESNEFLPVKNISSANVQERRSIEFNRRVGGRSSANFRERRMIRFRSLFSRS